VDLRGWGSALRSALTDPAVAMPHGEHPSQVATVVPNRNAVLLSVAASIAMTRNLRVVLTAVHAGDHAVYPDCRPEFVAAMASAFDCGTDGEVGLEAPYAHLTKADIARRALELGVPIDMTWSCYAGGSEPCTQCGACIARAQALAAT
jgi:7-cyano-7-deazaguanine synthase